MKIQSPNADILDPIETASIDEIRALQLTRMKWSLRHAYDNVPMYRQRFDQEPFSLADLASGKWPSYSPQKFAQK